MKQYKSLFIAAVALLALGSCSVNEVAPPETGRGIRFTTNLGGYAVKATDTEFESGDAVSLFVDEPINAFNVKMNCRDGELVPEQTIAWPEGTESSAATGFVAVYPYGESWELYTDANVFSVRPDQSTHAGYTASDLMIASYVAYPDCETVPLNFVHALCRFDLSVESALSEEISEVYLSGVYGKAQVFLTYHARTSTVADSGTIKMGRTWSANPGSDYYSTWSAILPPQSMSFKVLLVTASGKQYTYALPAGMGGEAMYAAHKYEGSLFLNEKSEATDFSVEVSEWTDNADVQFGSFIPDEFHAEGEWLLRSYNAETGSSKDLPFVKEYDLEGNPVFTMFLDNPEGAVYELFYTRNEINYFYYGFKGDTSTPKEPGSYSIEIGGTPISFASTGDLILELRPMDNTLTVREDNDVWSVIGEFDGDNWTVDFEMEKVRSGVYQITIPYFGEEFKFRCNGSWDVNLGLPKDWGDFPANRTSADNGKPVSSMERNGMNITLDSIGWWILELNVHNKTLRAYCLGSDDEIFDGYRSFLGNWYFYHDEDHEYSITITDAGTYYKMNFDGVPMKAKYDPVDNSMKINFQIFDTVESQYGTFELFFYAVTGDPETQEEYALVFGDRPDITLMKGKVAGDGQSITITPGIADGHPFWYYYIVRRFLDGDYANKMYAWFQDEFTFPQTWTKVNE